MFASFFGFSSEGSAVEELVREITLDGQLYRVGTSDPITDSNVNLTIQILNHDETCVIYEEQQTALDLSGTKGYFNIQVGSISTNNSKRTGNDPHNSMAKIFQNTSMITGVGCSYSPSAWVAETLQGITPSQLVQFNSGVASALVDLSSVTKGLLIPRMTTAQKNAIVSPATGLQVYDTNTNQINYFNGGSWVALGAGGGAGVTTINTGVGLTGGPITVLSRSLLGRNEVIFSTSIG